MSRLFDGVDDVMTYPISASGGADFGFGTLLVVARIVTTNDTSWLSFIEAENSANIPRYSFGRRSTGNLYYANDSTLNDAVSAQDADGWAIYAMTKATGTVAPTLHKIVISTGTRTSTAVAAMANSAGSAGGELRVGGPSDFANMRLALAAVFPGVVLTTTQLDGIASAKTTASIAALSPAWLVDDSDGLATDLIGTADRTAIVGTADDADDPAGWVYGLGGGGTDATVTGVPAAATGDVPAPTPSAGATVITPPADATGDLPSDLALSASVQTGPASGTGDFPAPAVTGSSDATVIAPAGDATGDFPPPTHVGPEAERFRSGKLNTGVVVVSARLTGAVAATHATGVVEVSAPLTGVAEVSARLTGVNEPHHVTGVREPAHFTGVNEPAHHTGAVEVLAAS